MAFQQFPIKSGVPSGTTAQRPSNPVTGDTYYDGTLGFLIIWEGTQWVPCSAPAAQPTITVADVGTNVAYGTVQGTVTFIEGNSGGKAAGFTATQGSLSSTSTSNPITLTITGNPGSYLFTGTAYNGFGTSPSAPNVSQTLTSLPDAPTIGTATNKATGGEISVAFTAGATGGKSITNYKYSTDGTTYTALSPAQTTSPLTISGLTNGTSYTVRIKAVNANGDSVASSASNSVTPSAGVSVDYLVVAGGGGGAAGEGGGGGAGGLRSTMNATGGGGTLQSKITMSGGTTYTVTVGGGGAGSNYGSGAAGGDGSPSVFATVSTVGGGGGARGANGSDEIGRPGGSGGGGGTSGGSNQKTGGAGTANEGYAGGTGAVNNASGGDKGAGGGGGAGGVGGNGSTTSYIGGNGGQGVDVSILGSSNGYAGGGGGAIFQAGTGGVGNRGGGSASNSLSGNGAAGQANTGGGGAGGNYSNGNGGAGGSGVVILRWLTADAGAITVGAGLTADATGTDGAYSYKRFTAGTGLVNF